MILMVCRSPWNYYINYINPLSHTVPWALLYYFTLFKDR